MDNPNDNATLTTTQVANLLHVSTQTVRDWTATGKINATNTPGGHRRYTVKAAYLALHRAHGTDRYWVDDVCLLINVDGTIETRYDADQADRYNNHPLTEADAPTLARLIAGAYIVHPPHTREVHIEGDQASLYLQAHALTKDDARRVLRDNVAAASTWLHTNVRPTTTITWVTTTGQQIEHW